MQSSSDIKTLSPSLKKTASHSSSESIASTDPSLHPHASVFSFLPTEQDKHIATVYPAGLQNNAAALYTVKLSTKNSSDVKVWRGDNIVVEPIGSATISKKHCDAELIMNGVKFHMKTNQFTGSTSINHPTFGKLKWRVSKMSGNPRALLDTDGTVLARHKTVGMHYYGGPRQMTMLTELDQDAMDVVVLMVVVARRLSGICLERMMCTYYIP